MSANLFSRSGRYSSLTSSENAVKDSPNEPPHVFRVFLKRNKTVLFSFFTGLFCTVVVVVFTAYLSRQILLCPAWALDCHVPQRIVWISRRIGTVQGINTAVYAIGLACLAFAAHAFSETALWPLLTEQPFTIGEMDTFLEASRGSVPSSPSALMRARNFHSAFVLLCTVIITLIPLSAAPTIGYVYDRQNVSTKFKSQYQPGGGIGPFFVQKNPPGPRREAAASLYTSWAYNLSSEPMPQYRDWFIDRQALVDRGNFTVGAVRMKQNVSCKDWNAVPTGMNRSLHSFETKLASHKRPEYSKYNQHSGEVLVRDRPSLAVWVHDYEFHSSTRTTATIIFAALNGTIKGGSTTSVSQGSLTAKMTRGNDGFTVSSIACDVDIALVDDILKVGSGTPGAPVQINSANALRDPSWNRSSYKGTLNELALWFAVAPVANGASVDGAQPMYNYNGTGSVIFQRYVSTNGGPNDQWTIDNIKRFIHISIGASALGDSTVWPSGGLVTLNSMANTLKLDPSRSLLLSIPPLIIMVLGKLLLFWNVIHHRRLEIPSMRLSTLGEFLKSAQTEDILRPAASDVRNSGRPSSLHKLRVEFVRTSAGYWGLQSPDRQQHRIRRKPLREYEMIVR